MKFFSKYINIIIGLIFLFPIYFTLKNKMWLEAIILTSFLLLISEIFRKLNNNYYKKNLIIVKSISWFTLVFILFAIIELFKSNPDYLFGKTIPENIIKFIFLSTLSIVTIFNHIIVGQDKIILNIDFRQKIKIIDIINIDYKENILRISTNKEDFQFKVYNKNTDCIYSLKEMISKMAHPENTREVLAQ